MKLWVRILPILLAALVFYASTPIVDSARIRAAESPANTNLQTVDSEGNKVACDEIDEAKDGILLGHIVPCISYTIEGATQKFTAAMIDMLKPVVFSFITFVIVMFGIKVLQVGEHDIKKDGFLLVFKIAMVIGLMELIPNYFVPQVYAVMAESQAIVTNGLTASSFHCDIDKYPQGATPMIWKQMDCIMGKLYGFTGGADGKPNMLLGASVLGALGGFFVGGAFGVTVFFALIGVLVSLFMLVIRTATAFVNGYLIVCMMLIISPLFMPLILLRATTNYFEPWWKNILAGFLMPVIITAYSILALTIYDKLLFDPGDPNVPREPALINKLFDNELMKKAQQLPRQACNDRQVTNNPASRNPTASQQALDKLYGIPVLGGLLSGTSTGGNSICSQLQVPNLKLSEGSPEFANQRESFNQLFLDAMKLLVLAFIVNAGMQQVLKLVGLLTGTSAPAAALTASTPMEAKLQQAFSGAQRDMKAAFDDVDKNGAVKRNADGSLVSPAGVRGSEFIGGIPGAAAKGASSFLQTMRK